MNEMHVRVAAIVTVMMGMVGVSALSGLPISARAETIRNFHSGTWFAGAYTNDQSKQFSHCAASASYRSGILMMVSIGRDFGWRLGFANDAWNMTSNQQIPVKLVFDTGAPWDGTAIATNSKAVAIPMATNSAIINAFRASTMMTAYASGQVFQFRLDGTSRLMVDLSRCVATELAAERGEPPPHFADAPPAPAKPAVPTPSVAPPQNVELELAATRIASNLLLEAKFPHARLLTANDTPPALKGRGAAWSSDLGPGAVALLPASVASDPQQAASQLISSDAVTCKGDFASGRSSELVDDKLITKAFTGCKESTGTRAFRYFILQRPGSGFVVYELAGPSASSSEEGDSRAPRDATFQAAAVKAAFSP
jgi:hypothetical protein